MKSFKGHDTVTFLPQLPRNILRPKVYAVHRHVRIFLP